MEQMEVLSDSRYYDCGCMLQLFDAITAIHACFFSRFVGHDSCIQSEETGIIPAIRVVRLNK